MIEASVAQVAPVEAAVGWVGRPVKSLGERPAWLGKRAWGQAPASWVETMLAVLLRVPAEAVQAWAVPDFATWALALRSDGRTGFAAAPPLSQTKAFGFSEPSGPLDFGPSHSPANFQQRAVHPVDPNGRSARCRFDQGPIGFCADLPGGHLVGRWVCIQVWEGSVTGRGSDGGSVLAPRRSPKNAVL